MEQPWNLGTQEHGTGPWAWSLGPGDHWAWDHRALGLQYLGTMYFGDRPGNLGTQEHERGPWGLDPGTWGS